MLHIYEDGIGFGEFIGLRLDGGWIGINRKERAKIYKKDMTIVKVITCKICYSPCIFPFYGGGEHPKNVL